MRYPRCWLADRVREVFTTESRQKTRELFLQTHRPFRRIRVDFCKEHTPSGPFIAEEELRTLVEQAALNAPNRLFFITGEAGSGKSELCQWLEYTVDQRRCLPIHIPRSMTSAAHVVALLREQVGKGVAQAGLPHVPLATRAEYIALSAVVLLYEQQSQVLTPVSQWERLLNSSGLKQAIADHLAAADSQQHAHRLLPCAEEVQTLCEQCGILVEPAQLPHVWRELRHLLDRVLEQTLWVGDVRGLLAHLSEQVLAQGRRPLLLLEDVTAFRVLGDHLLDYLLDLTSGHFDAVIGVTTGYERTQLAAALAGDLTHIHHRLRARFVLTDEQGRSYGLADDVCELARAYLQAVRTDCASCQQAQDCAYAFADGLYPFTATALLRAFNSLHEEGNPRQTPRLLLEHVLSACLLADVPPPFMLEQSSYLVAPPTCFRSDEVRSDELQTLLRWYGEINDTTITLDPRIAACWDIPVPAERLHSERIQVTRAYVAAPPDTPTLPTDWHQELRELQQWLTTGGVYPGRETLKQGIERMLFEFGDPRSLSNPHALSLSKAEISYARGDERIPIFLGRDSGDQPVSQTSLKVQISGTVEERGILEELVYLALSQAEIAQVCRNPALTLHWAQQHWTQYNTDIRALLQQQLGGIMPEHLVLIAWQMITLLYTDGAEVDALFHQDSGGNARAGTTNITNNTNRCSGRDVAGNVSTTKTAFTIRVIKEEGVRSPSPILGEGFGERATSENHAVRPTLESGGRWRHHAPLLLPAADELAADYAATTPWSASKHASCYKAGARLAAWYEPVRRLFIGFFMLRDSLLDRERYAAAMRHFDPTQLLEQCAALQLAGLRSMPFRLRPMGSKLYDLLVPLQQYAHALVQFDVSLSLQADLQQLEEWQAHLASQLAMDIAQLRSQLKTLRWRCGEVGVVWREPWDATLDWLQGLTHEQVQTLHAQVGALAQSTRQRLTDQAYDIWSYQVFRHTLRPLLQHPYWAARAVLQTIQHELLTTARSRYRTKGKMLTATQPYRAYLQTIRTIQQELRDDESGRNHE